METFEFAAMNTRVVLYAQGPSAAEGFERVQEYVAEREAQLTRFRDTSELAALNRAAGSWFNASPELFEVMQEAQALYFETGGLFDPAVLPALEGAGYDASMEIVRGRASSTGEEGPRTRAPERAPRARARGDFRAVSFHAGQRAIWMPEGMRVDLGGIAKGWIVERAARRLAEFADACAVNAGGDLFAVGLPEGAEAWEVEIEDPNDAAGTVALLRVPGGAVATSSITKRRWKQDGQEQHHLIDPRTGLPATTDWLSVTVLAPHATPAEVFAKALLIAGPEQAGALLERRAEIDFIAADRAGRLWGTDRAKELLDGTDGAN